MKKIMYCTLVLTFLVFPVFNVGGQALELPDSWYTYNDKDSGGDSTIKLSTGKQTISGKEYMVVSSTGKVTKKFEYGFVGFGIRLEGEDQKRFRNAKGIKFKVLGDGKSYRVRTESSDVTDYDYHGKVFVAGGAVTEITVPFSSVKQEGWGAPKGGFKKNTLVQVSFQTVGQPHDSISLKVFDLQPLN